MKCRKSDHYLESRIQLPIDSWSKSKSPGRRLIATSSKPPRQVNHDAARTARFFDVSDCACSLRETGSSFQYRTWPAAATLT
jgi:hypothetical protein